MKKQQWSYGLVSFCNAKQLQIGNVVKSFIDHYKLEGNDKDQIVADNWQKFASFVNTGLLKGTIKGRNVSVSNGSAEYERERNKQYFETPVELRKWWSSMSGKKKDKYAILQSYFAKNNLPWVQQTDSEVPASRNAPRYEAIVNAGLLDHFNEHLKEIE